MSTTTMSHHFTTTRDMVASERAIEARWSIRRSFPHHTRSIGGWKLHDHVYSDNTRTPLLFMVSFLLWFWRQSDCRRR
jgi:hypothetical protein